MAPLALEGDEAHHSHAVMRRSIGDEVTIFDGTGRSALSKITSTSSKRVELELLSMRQDAPPPVHISLLQAIPKGGNMELIIEKAVELGVQHIHPVTTAHTVVKLKGDEIAKKQSKWQRVALEACKQCGQNWLPVVHSPVSFDQVWSVLPAHDLRLIAALQPDARSLKDLISHLPTDPQQVLVAIGPEGDFSPAEYSLAREQNCRPITLGPIILRVETAAMFCLSVLAHELLLHQQHHHKNHPIE